jgi:hypothetical protein
MGYDMISCCNTHGMLMGEIHMVPMAATLLYGTFTSLDVTVNLPHYENVVVFTLYIDV